MLWSPRSLPSKSKCNAFVQYIIELVQCFHAGTRPVALSISVINGVVNQEVMVGVIKLEKRIHE